MHYYDCLLHNFVHEISPIALMLTHASVKVTCFYDSIFGSIKSEKWRVIYKLLVKKKTRKVTKQVNVWETGFLIYLEIRNSMKYFWIICIQTFCLDFNFIETESNKHIYIECSITSIYYFNLCLLQCT